MSHQPPVTIPALASLDQDRGADGTAVIGSLARLLHDAGRIGDTDTFVEAALAREALGSTVLPGGVALPHARSHAVTAASVAVARLPAPVRFGAESAWLVLLIAAPGDDSARYLALLQQLAAACVKNAFVADLEQARTSVELADLVSAAAGVP